MNPKILFQDQLPSQLSKNPPFQQTSNVSPKTILSLPILELIKKYQKNLKSPSEKEATKIHVDEIASKVAYFYERIIKIIDWKEENLLRRNAIERFLKRNLIGELPKVNFIFKINVAEISEPLVKELIRGGHLPNDEISQEKIPVVQGIIEKYLYIIKNAPFGNSSFILKKRVNFYNWILEIAACEIEEILSPPLKENDLMETMALLMAERIHFEPENSLSEEEKLLQTYIAVHRTLFDLDEAIIAYHLLKYRLPQWIQSSPALKDQVTKNIFLLQESLENDLHHPLSREFFNLCERTDTAFTLIGDILDQFRNEPERLPEVFDNKTELKAFLTRDYNQRLATLKSRLFKLAIFSSLSVFVSNWFTFFVVEVPLAHLFYQGFNLPAAIFDFFIPTLTMFLLVAAIKAPGKSNLGKTVKLTYQFIYPDEAKETYAIKLKKKKRPITNFFIIAIYVIACFAFLYGVGWLFYIVKIPWTSVILDTVGIALNIFAALVIRNKAKEITVEEKTSFGEFLLDIISLPVAEIGSWLASKWKEYNIVSVFFNVVIETPFVTFIDFLENWRQFLKERKASFH